MEQILTIDIITLFPEMFSALEMGITGRAIDKHLLKINTHDLRSFAVNKHRRVDDRPYGGQCGMVLQYEPLKRATESIFRAYNQKDIPVILMCPKGKTFSQSSVKEIIDKKHIIIVCGRYQGIDQRYIDRYVTQAWSIGNYILTGGELACMVMIDCASRALPGALGNKESYSQGTHQSENEAPLYTRPSMVDGMRTPSELLSGNPKQIMKWKAENRD